MSQWKFCHQLTCRCNYNLLIFVIIAAVCYLLNCFRFSYSIRLESMKDLLGKFAEIDSNRDGLVDLNEFAEYLNLPVTRHIRHLFSLYDRVSSFFVWNLGSKLTPNLTIGRRGGPMVSALVPRASGPGSSPEFLGTGNRAIPFQWSERIFTYM